MDEPVDGPVTKQRETAAIRELVIVQGLEKSFDEGGRRRRVLAGIDLEAGRGEFVSITGPSGSGKSTLLNIIGGIDTADSGRVVVGDTEISGLDEKTRTLVRRHRLGFVFQFFNLVPTLTVAENLALPLKLCGRPAPPELIDSWLARFGLADRAGAYPRVLSGGEQQRVAVIRAAIHEPEVILADEPTGNLDREAGARVLALLKEVTAAGASVIMATHSEVAAAAADRVLGILDGRLSQRYK